MKMKNLLLLIFSLVLASSLCFGQAGVSVTNAGTTGTTLNSLAIFNTSNNAVLATTSNTAVPAFIVVGGAGTSGLAVLAIAGEAPCTFDANTSSAGGFYVIASVTTAGDCHAQSAAPSSGTWVVGYLASGSTTSGSTANVLIGGYIYGAGSAAVTSVANSDSSLTISPTTGAVVASLNTAHANTFTGNQTVTGHIIMSGHDVAIPLNAADTSGSGTAQTATTSPSYTPATDDCITYTTTTTNSGTGLTTNINSLGAKSIAIPSLSGWTTTLTANIIPANKPLHLCYDGTNWDLQQTGTTAGATTLTYWSPGGYISSAQTANANLLTCGGFVAPNAISNGHITVNVNTADNTNLSSIEIYGSTGTLIGSVTAFTSATTANRTFAWSQGTVTVPAGKNYLCITSVGSTFAIGAYGNNSNFYPVTITTITSTSGAAPSSITPPSDVINVTTTMPAFVLTP